MIRYFLLALAVAPLLPTSGCPPKFPTASLSPGSIVFSPQVVSVRGESSVTQTVTLTAGGKARLSITGIDASGDFSQTNDCPPALSPGGTCDIQVSFTPNSIGIISGAVTLSSNAFGGPHVVTLTGTGTPPVGFSPASLDFGSISVNATSSAQSVTLTNNQSATLAISGVGVSGDYSQTNNCPSSLGAGQSCQISVQFTPTLATAIPGALNVITDASPGTEPVALAGVGTGSSSSGVAFSAASLAFGNQEAGSSSTQKSITLTNQGSTSLTVQSVGASAGYAGSNNCTGKILSTGDTCTIHVTFQPDADFAPVDYPGAITIVDSDSTSPQVIGLSGSGVAPITSSPATADFGQILLNTTSAPLTVTLTNNDAATEGLTLTQSGGFAVADTTCGNSLKPGATCTADLTFSAHTIGGVGSGPTNGALTIAPSSGGFLSPQVVNLKACATTLSVTPPRFNFGAVAVGSTSPPETMTVSNGFGENFKVSATAVTGADPGDFAITNNTCTSSVAGSCTMDVTYAPQAGGTRSANVTVTDDDGCSPHQQPLTGGSSTGPFTLYVNSTGVDATGTVTSSPAGINCSGAACSANFASGTSVTLTATGNTSQPGTHFSGWSGACTGTGTCTLDMDGDKQVTAAFVPDPQMIVAIAGTGNGSVTSNPPGIDCEVPLTSTTNCTATFPLGASVALTATAGSQSKFGGWSGAGCSGTGKCSFTSSSDQTVTATFDSTAPDFSMSASAAAPSTIAAGHSATSSVTLTSMNGFTSSVNFTCSVQPAPAFAPTCALNPLVVTPAANGSASTKLSINTSAPSAAAFPFGSRNTFYALWLPLMGLAWVGVGLSRRLSGTRKVWFGLLGCMVLSAFALQTACGGGTPVKPPPSGGTPSGAYTITVSGTSGSTQHSTTVNVTVQ